MKTHRLDKILLNILAFFIIFIWVHYFIAQFTSTLLITILIFIAVRTIFIHATNRYQRLKHISAWEMSQTFAIMGAEKTCHHFFKLVPEPYNPTIESNYIIFTKNKESILLLTIFKTTAVSTEEILKAWRFAQEKNIHCIWVVAHQKYRDTIALANSLEGQFIFFNAKQIHRFLLNHNALPQKNFTLKKSKNRMPFRVMISDIFSRKRAKYFLFSGFMLAILSFFIPLTIYYLVMSTIMFVMSITCLILDR